jgi:hypothetical protein
MLGSGSILFVLVDTIPPEKLAEADERMGVLRAGARGQRPWKKTGGAEVLA